MDVQSRSWGNPGGPWMYSHGAGVIQLGRGSSERQSGVTVGCMLGNTRQHVFCVSQITFKKIKTCTR